MQSGMIFFFKNSKHLENLFLMRTKMIMFSLFFIIPAINLICANESFRGLKLRSLEFSTEDYAQCNLFRFF